MNLKMIVVEEVICISVLRLWFLEIPRVSHSTDHYCFQIDHLFPKWKSFEFLLINYNKECCDDVQLEWNDWWNGDRCTNKYSLTVLFTIKIETNPSLLSTVISRPQTCPIQKENQSQKWSKVVEKKNQDRNHCARG